MNDNVRANDTKKEEGRMRAAPLWRAFLEVQNLQQILGIRLTRPGEGDQEEF